MGLPLMFTVPMIYDKELPLSNHTTFKRVIQTEIITQVSIDSYTFYSEDCRDLGMSIPERVLVVKSVSDSFTRNWHAKLLQSSLLPLVM